MSFLKRLFGLGDRAAPAPASFPEVEHKGFTIRPTPYFEAGQHQTSGLVIKEIGGVVREHRFVRADRFATAEEAADFAVAKGRLIIDERGDRLFD